MLEVNEILNHILSAGMQIISCTYIVTKLNNKKINLKEIKIWILLIILGLSMILVSLHSYPVYKPILMYISMIIIYKYMLKITINETVISNFISLVIHFISEALIAILIMMLQIPTEIIQKYLQITPLSLLLTLGIIYIIMKFFEKYILKLKELLMKEKSIFFFYMLIAIALIILLWRNLPNWQSGNIAHFLTNFFIVILFITTMILLFKGRYDVYKTKNEFDELFKQSQSVKTLLQRYKKHNHENKNQLLVIRENSLGNDKVVNYIDSILKENVGHEDKWISELSYITDAGISGFLSVKINHMVDNKIKVSLTVSPKVKNFKFENIEPNKYKDICRILGIYLDNAYEASKKTRKKEVTIEMLIDNKKLLIIISNSYKGKIELDKLDNEGYTTKGKSRGVGLSLVKDIIRSNKSFEQKRHIIKDYFYQYFYISK